MTEKEFKKQRKHIISAIYEFSQDNVIPRKAKKQIIKDYLEDYAYLFNAFTQL